MTAYQAARAIPDTPRRAHAAAYGRIYRVPDWLLWVAIEGVMLLVLFGWNLRMGV